MKRILGTILIVLVSIGAAWAQDADTRLLGSWEGTLPNMPNPPLRLILRIAARADGTLTGTLDSPDQEMMGIPVPTIVLDGNNVQMTIPLLHAQFTGTMIDSGPKRGDFIYGEFSRLGLNLPLALLRAAVRPQEPKPPFPYQVEPVLVTNPRTGTRLAGTLTYPKDEGPFPVVVLIAGSETSDRDGSIEGHKPFWILADYLTRRGIAVLRYDKQNIRAKTSSHTPPTFDNYTDDAQAVVEYLKARQDKVDPTHIGLIGHSEGGIMAAMVANRLPDMSFLVLLAGDCMIGEQILLQHGAASARMVADDAAVAEGTAMQKALFAILKQHPDDETARQQLHQYMTDRINDLPEARRQALEAQYQNLGGYERSIQLQIASLVNPWMRRFLIYDPATDLRTLRVPVLALNGSKDTVVTAKENLAAINAALKESGTKDITVRELPGLNHLFQTAKTGSPQEYAQIDETFAPEALQIIGDWVVERTKKQ